MSDQMQNALATLKAQRALVAEAIDLFARMHAAGMVFPGLVRGRGGSGPSNLLDLAEYYLDGQPNVLQLSSYKLEPNEKAVGRLLLITLVNISEEPVSAAITLHDQNGESIGVEVQFVVLAPNEETEAIFRIPAREPRDGEIIQVKAATGLKTPYALHEPQ